MKFVVVEDCRTGNHFLEREDSLLMLRTFETIIGKFASKKKALEQFPKAIDLTKEGGSTA